VLQEPLPESKCENYVQSKGLCTKDLPILQLDLFEGLGRNSLVEQSSKQIGIEHFGAHDLRRTCAKLCRKNGGDLEQIKFLLGHSSIQTTERYLGSEQEIVVAVNDNLGL
jgi:integrase